jgi:hypothetical protein
MRILISVFVFVIQILLHAHSTTYYLDNISGNDSYDGISPERPWKTISKVNGISFTPGDKLLLKRGSTWYEQLNLKGSGTPGNPILGIGLW